MAEPQVAPSIPSLLDAESLRWLFGYVRPHKGRLIAVLVLSALATAIITAQPYIMKLIIDDGILAGDFAWLTALTGLLLATGIVNLGVGGVNRYQHVKLSGLVLFTMREAVYGHLQTLSPAYFAAARSGDVLQKLDGDVAALQRFSVDAVLAAVNGVLGLIGALALMLWLSWELTLVALVLLPVEALFLRRMRPRVEVRTRTVRERLSDLTAFLVETLPAMKFIQSVAAEAREVARLRRLNQRYLGDLLRLQVTEFLTAAVPNLLTSASRALVFLAGGAMIIRGELTIGTLIAFSTYLGFAVGPVQSLFGVYIGMMRMAVSLDRVRSLTMARPAVRPTAMPRPLPADGVGGVVFDSVEFAYPGDSSVVLDGASLTIRGGTKVGVAGISGAGKTTLIDLLHRHFDPQAGRIVIDGIDLRELDLAALRQTVAVVAQDIVLFRGSIADNIRYAAPEADAAAVRAAAARAQIDTFVSTLPEGYDTPVGERGARLSGGQRQRLAIARAVLQDPRILVMDEATSAVDLETERRLVEAVDAAFADRTRIIISHRPDALIGTDEIVTLVDGQLMPQSSGRATHDTRP